MLIAFVYLGAEEHTRTEKVSHSMSLQFIKMPLHLLRSTLTNQAKVIYLHLASFRPSYPGHRLLRKLTSYGNSTISKAIKELETANLIKTHRGSRKDRQANSYEVISDSSLWNLKDVIPQWGNTPLPIGSTNREIKYRKAIETTPSIVSGTRGEVSIPPARPTRPERSLAERLQSLRHVDVVAPVAEEFLKKTALSSPVVPKPTKH
jgi:hypothetical protein